jgi:uncharacterized protein HemX
LADLWPILAGFGLALLAAGAGAGLGWYSTRARHSPRTPADRLREQAEQLAAQEKLEEVAEVIERRRRRVEAAEQRARQRDAAIAQASQEQGSDDGTSVAHLSVPEQLAWAAKRARHRPLGGGSLQ